MPVSRSSLWQYHLRVLRNAGPVSDNVRRGKTRVWWYGTSMATSKVTFTLDEGTVNRLQDASARLAKPKSEIVREAILEFYDRIGRLSERERLGMLRAFDELVPKIPPRSAKAADHELSAVRKSRKMGGRRTAGANRN